VREPGRTAIGTWSGGRFLRFGEAVEETRLESLLLPNAGIDTVLSATPTVRAPPTRYSVGR